MLINLSNHPYSGWSAPQKEASEVYGKCIDLPFPPIPPEADPEDIGALADIYLSKVLSLGSDNSTPDDDSLTVHIMGEQTFCYTLINRLFANGIRCVASCSSRNVETMPDGKRLVSFNFTRFREYLP